MPLFFSIRVLQTAVSTRLVEVQLVQQYQTPQLPQFSHHCNAFCSRTPCKGYDSSISPPPCFFIYLLFEKILVLLIVDRRKFLNWSSTWNKPLVMNHLLKSFLLLLIRPAHYNYLDLIICRQAGGIWWGSH